MNALAHLNTSVQTMSSREISELTGKRHDNVLADIRKMLAEIQSPEISGDYKDAMGRVQPSIVLDKEQTLCLVAGYSAPLRMAIIRRWQSLEAEKSPRLPQTLAEALRFAADIAEQKQIAEEQRDEAIATKAEIGSRREATAMNTASIAVKKATALEIELDRSKSYATVKRMQMIHHGQEFNWRLLKSASADIGIEPIEVFDVNYGTVKAYHADAWREAYAIEICA